MICKYFPRIFTRQDSWFFFCRSETALHWLNLYLVKTATLHGSDTANAHMVLVFKDGSTINLVKESAINCAGEFELMRSKALRRKVG